MRNPRVRPVVAALLFAGLAACGQEGREKAAKAPEIDACALFTQQDAQAVAGESVSFMSSTLEDARGRDPLQCSYNAGNTANPRILSLLVRPPAGSAEQAERLHRSIRSSLDTMVRGDLRDVPGLGDAAFWAGGSLHQLHVLAGRYRLVITAQLGEGHDALEAARRIAAAVLPRLKQA